MNLIAWAYVVAIVGPLLLLVGKILFGGWRGFFEASEALFIMDLEAALTGDDPEPRPSKFLMLIFLIFAGVATAVAYYLISGWLACG
jgi:hypothetical protein